jgi:hypothetical protein
MALMLLFQEQKKNPASKCPQANKGDLWMAKKY